MDRINGSQTSAIIFTTNNEHAVDAYAKAQLQMICDNPVSKGSRIRVMPDVHPGKVGTIGLTMTIKDSIMPNLTGIDIGCGISVARVKVKKIEYQKLDTVIRDYIPSGSEIRGNAHQLADSFDFDELLCADAIRKDNAKRSLGTLGGGNHFIEVDQGEDGGLYFVVHSGSRHLGKEVTEHYLNRGQKELKEQGIELPYELTVLRGRLMECYLHDVQVVQRYASLNRQIILEELIRKMKFKAIAQYECIHNYVDNREDTISLLGAPVLRKGAISALQDERVIIPINMRDGIILGTGLGNTEWNMSAPHGSGRIYKRNEVANYYTVSQFKKEMKGIYSSSVGKDTLDEAPFAYRGLAEIAEVIVETVKIEQVLKPVYNFKAGSGMK